MGGSGVSAAVLSEIRVNLLTKLRIYNKNFCLLWPDTQIRFHLGPQIWIQGVLNKEKIKSLTNKASHQMTYNTFSKLSLLNLKSANSKIMTKSNLKLSGGGDRSRRLLFKYGWQSVGFLQKSVLKKRLVHGLQVLGILADFRIAYFLTSKI